MSCDETGGPILSISALCVFALVKVLLMENGRPPQRAILVAHPFPVVTEPVRLLATAVLLSKVEHQSTELVYHFWCCN